MAAASGRLNIQAADGRIRRCGGWSGKTLGAGHAAWTRLGSRPPLLTSIESHSTVSAGYSDSVVPSRLYRYDQIIATRSLPGATSPSILAPIQLTLGTNFSPIRTKGLFGAKFSLRQPFCIPISFVTKPKTIRYIGVAKYRHFACKNRRALEFIS